MSKDYFEDIVPGDLSQRQSDNEDEVSSRSSVSTRSIRNVPPPQRPVRRPSGADARLDIRISKKGRRRTQIVLWVGALAAVLVCTAVGILAFRPTVVTATPRTAPVIFDAQTSFIASLNAASSSLAYTIGEADFQDSATVAASGTEHAEDRASGLVTVYNEYSDAPVRLIKNTRFESSNGLIFRIPESVVVPGKKGSTPGSVSVSVIADQPGDSYNVAAGRFTVPGLKSTPDMFKGVYAVSSAAMEGGFVGDRPGVAPGALERAKADVRARLEAKAREQVAAIPAVFPEFIRIRYQSQPQTTDPDGSVRIHESAHVTYPIFDAAQFANIIGRSTSASVTATDVLKFEPDSGLKAVISDDQARSIGSGDFTFALQGSGKLVWGVDGGAVASALAGKNTATFENIIAGFTGISEAHARVSPFWASSFPAESGDITVKIEEKASK